MGLPASTAFDALNSGMWSAFTGMFAFLTAMFSLALGFTVMLRARRLRNRQQEERRPLDEKLARVQDLSKELSALNTEVQAEFELQMAATAQAKREAESAAALAALSDEQREAAARLVRAQIGEAFDKNTKTERWFQVGLSALSFIAGVVATVIVTVAMSG